MTQARTWIIISGLAALFVSLGYVFGGTAGLILFAGIAMVFNLVMFWKSDKLALKASKARPVDRSEAPELYRDIEEIAGRAGVPMPRVYLIPSEQPNAFATGRSPKKAVVAVTEGLLRYLPREQVKGVLAHEMAHIANRDILVMTIAAMIGAAISAIANILQFSMFFGGGDDDDNPLGIVGVLVAIIVAPLAAMILQLAVSRQREYLADATAAQYLGEGRPLAEALGTLERGVEAVPMNVNPATEVALHREPAQPEGSDRPLLDPPADAGADQAPRRARRRERHPLLGHMRRGGLWQRIKRALGLAPPEPPAAPPDEEPALVPSGPPRRPLGSGAVALELPEEPNDVDARGSRLELADDGLDVVPVGIEQKGGVVVAGVVRAVLLTDAGLAVVAEACFDPGAMERVDLGSAIGDERDVHGAAGFSAGVALEDDEVRELGAAIAFPERRDRQRLEDRLVEADARRRIGDADLDVVEDDARPVPVDHGGDLSEAANA